MHTLAAFIVTKPEDVEKTLLRFQENWGDSDWGYWDWWSNGGRWAEELEAAGCEPTEDGYYVLSLEKAKGWEPPIVVTPFGHVFDSDQMTYEVSRGPAWGVVRDSIFDEFALRRGEYVAVMVDVHS